MIAGSLMSTELRGENRFAFQPSIEIAGVSDSNLFFSSSAPASDRILRIRPVLGFTFASRRLSASIDYSIDNDRYADHSQLSDARARQYGALTFSYDATPRLSFALDSKYVDTNTPAELNVLTDLGALRRRARQISAMPSARYRLSPLVTAHASISSTTQEISGASVTRALFVNTGVDRKMTAIDSLAVNLEQGRYVFTTNRTPGTTSTTLLQTQWTRRIDATTDFAVSGGPRRTAGSTTAELGASLTHRWQNASVTMSASKTQTTAIGISDTLQVRVVDLRLQWSPTESLTAYVTPAVFRTSRRGLQATVYHAGVGAHYAITPLAGFDVAYSFDEQHGGIDLTQIGAFSRGVLSLGLSTRWSMPDRIDR